MRVLRKDYTLESRTSSQKGKNIYHPWIDYAMMMVMSQHQSEELMELYALVSGRVQGVGFRYFVIRSAQPLAVRGYTRNTEEGQVEVVAQGSRGALDQLLTALRRGPSAAEVEQVETNWRQPTSHFSGFHIRY
jgi:acylphosphatase